MTYPNIRETVVDLALQAAAPPSDLAARIETRYRRRRKARVLTASGLCIAVLAAGAWATTQLPRHGPKPPGVVPAAQPFVVPTSFDDPRPVPEVWPRSVVLHHVSDTLVTSAFALLDREHLLVRGADNKTFDAYNLRTGTRRTLVPDTGYEAHSLYTPPTVTAHWLVWMIGNPAGGATFYRAPITGGDRQKVATVHADSRVGVRISATDEYIYWVWANELFRVPMAGGTPTTVPGFAHAFLDGSAWAMVVPTSDDAGFSFRNIVTGEYRAVTAVFRNDDQPGCTWAFCLSSTTDHHLVISHLDGTNQTVLPKRFNGPPEDSLLSAGGHGLIKGAGVVLDPLTGAYATVVPNGEVECGWVQLHNVAATVITVTHAKSCRGPVTQDLVYVIPG